MHAAPRVKWKKVDMINDYLNLQQSFGQYRSAESLYCDCEADLVQNSTV